MRVFLADDKAEVRSALRLLLEQDMGMTVVGEAAEAGALLAQVEVACPDLVLADRELPGMGMGELLSALRSSCPHLFLVALSGQPEARASALAAGADAFVSKKDPPDRLLSTLRTARSR